MSSRLKSWDCRDAKAYPLDAGKPAAKSGAFGSSVGPARHAMCPMSVYGRDEKSL